MKESSFVILHEGVIQNIEGRTPGKILLTIDCKYLRQKHKAPGTTFTIELSNCKKIHYLSDEGKSLSDPQDIIKEKVEILSASLLGELVEVYCASGTLTLDFDKATIYLNEKTTISTEDLETLAQNYWDEWESCSKAILHH